MVNYWITYNNIQLKVLTWAQPYAGVAQLETNGTYLYTRHTLAARCIYNPFVNSFNEQRDFQGRPVGQLPAASEGVAGRPGIITHKNIKHYLLQPRQRLVLSLQTRLTWELNAAPNPATEVVEILRSPLAHAAGPFTTDATNGPTPLHCDVVGMTGAGKSVIVDFVIQTDINECAGKDGSQSLEKLPVVLSHVWEAVHHIDDQFDTTRVIHGRAVLRGDVMRARNIRPDDFRQAFFHPLPNGFKRDDVNVTATDDGLRVAYTIVDRQVPWALLPPDGQDNLMRGISHIEAVHTAEINKPSADDVIMAAGGAALRGATRVATALQRGWGSAWIPTPGLALTVPAAIAMGAIDLGISTIHLVPREYHYITVRVYGDKIVPRERLRFLADDIVLRRAVQTGFVTDEAGNRRTAGWAGVYYTVTESLEPKYVEVTLKIRQAVLQALIQPNFNNAGLNLAGLAADLVGSLVTSVATAFNNITSINRNAFNYVWNSSPRDYTQNPPAVFRFATDAASNVASPLYPPHAGGTRGNYVASLVAQALSEPCSPPPTTLGALADSAPVDLANVDMTLLPANPTQVR